MDCKTKTVVLILLVWNICVQGGGHNSDSTIQQNKQQLVNNLQTLFKDYYSSSFLWQCMAHYFNKSELALPGFSDVFHEFSKIDRQHANRVLELTALHGFRFKAYSIDTSNIVKEAISNYKRNAGKFPLCKETKFNDEEKDDLFLFIRNKHKNKTVLPRAFSILKLTQMIENCYMTINLNQWKDPHLKYVIQREFSTEKLYRRKYISDLMQKLKKGNPLVEFVIDKILRSTVLKY